jgi:hypothetical protein
MARCGAGNQQVPHRAFGPVRNDIPFFTRFGGFPFYWLIHPSRLSFQFGPLHRLLVTCAAAILSCLSLKSCHSDARCKRARNLLSCGVAGFVVAQANSRFLTGPSAPFGMTSLFLFGSVRNDIPFLGSVRNDIIEGANGDG